MYNKAKKGFYKVINKDKVIAPIDSTMGSFIIENDNIFLEYKSSLELKAIRYCDFNKHVKKYSLEPFNIKYVKPTDGKVHRYFIDLFIEFSTGDRFIVEIKSKSETKEPKKPKKNSQKAIINYQKAIMTYAVNRAKWDAARAFAKDNGLKFIILTEEELV